MNFAEIAAQPLGLTTEDAGKMVASPQLFEHMIMAGWIKPVVNRHRLRLWDVEDVKTCWARIRLGNYPEIKRS